MEKPKKIRSDEEVQLQTGKSLIAAEQFLTASRRSFDTRIKGDVFDPSLPQPAAVLAAFSVELVFKSIMLAKTGKFSEGHNLTELFKKLPLDVQQDLATGVIDKMKTGQKVDQTFDELLADNQEVFNIWRYSFETSEMISADLTFLWTLSEAAMVLRRNLRAAH